MATKVRQDAKAAAKGLVLVFLVLEFSSPLMAQVSPSADQTRPARSVIVSIPDRKLAVIERDTVIATFSIAVGAQESPSPTGEFRIVNRVSNPTYYHSGSVIPSGKDNPVGTRWIGLSQKGYGIHGTNAPRSIGRAASHGCIRLRNRDIERLFTLLRVGDVVEIHGERDEQVASIFGDSEQDVDIETAQAPAQTGTDAGNLR